MIVNKLREQNAERAMELSKYGQINIITESPFLPKHIHTHTHYI